MATKRRDLVGRPEHKPEGLPVYGQDTVTIEGTRVTLRTIKYEDDKSEVVESAHVMFAHDDVHSLKFKFPFYARPAAVKLVAKEIQARRAKEEVAADPPPEDLPDAIHRLVNEARAAYDTHGDEVDLEALNEAADWVRSHLVKAMRGRDSIPVKEP